MYCSLLYFSVYIITGCFWLTASATVILVYNCLKRIKCQHRMWLLCPCVPSSISDGGYNCESKMGNFKIVCNSFLLMQTIITVCFDDKMFLC